MTGSPGGERWEVYTVLADSETFVGENEAGPECCSNVAVAAGT